MGMRVRPLFSMLNVETLVVLKQTDLCVVTEKGVWAKMCTGTMWRQHYGGSMYSSKELTNTLL